MSAHRTALRAAVKDVLAADSRIGAFRYFDAWSRPKDGKALPGYTVFIPKDPSAIADDDTVERRTVIHVIIKRGSSSDIETDIDADVVAIEACVLPALRDLAIVTNADLDGPDFEISGEGSSNFYQAVVGFSVQLFHPIPTAS